MGVYAQGEFVYSERLTLIPGIRIDIGQFSAGDIAGGLDTDDTAISPKLAVMYKINDSFSVFGSLAHTERMPTLDERYSTEAAGTLPARLASTDLRQGRSRFGRTWALPSNAKTCCRTATACN